MRARNRQLQRVLRLRQRVAKSRVVSLHQLAVEFTVSVRTIRRDLEALEAVGEHVPTWREKRERYEFECEICGEPAGGGGALCPVHLEEAGIRA